MYVTMHHASVWASELYVTIETYAPESGRVCVFCHGPATGPRPEDPDSSTPGQDRTLRNRHAAGQSASDI